MVKVSGNKTKIMFTSLIEENPSKWEEEDLDLPFPPKTNQTNQTSNSKVHLQCLREVLEAALPHSNKDRPVVAVKGEGGGVEEEIRINSEQGKGNNKQTRRLDRRSCRNNRNLDRAFL